MTELEAINRMLANIGQAPVNNVDQANPDVAICSRTLKQVSQEVQSEGWAFNRIRNFKQQPDANGIITIRKATVDGDSNYIMQMDLSHDSFYSRDKIAVGKVRGSDICLFEQNSQSFDWGSDPIEVDKIYYFSEIGTLPVALMNYVISRGSAMLSYQTVGDGQQYNILAQQEAYTRAQLLEYETSQGDYTFFGHPKGSNYYNSYQPFHTLRR